MLLDKFGANPPVTLRTVDVSALESGVQGIAERIEALLSIPPMLSPTVASDAEDSLEQLYGEEYELSNLVSEFTRSLGALRNIDLDLPIVQPSSVLLSRLESGAASEPVFANPLVVAEDLGDQERIETFVEEVQRTREDGRKIFAELQNAFERLSEGCRLYADARSNSINVMHASWLDVLQRATWCNRRFYCARTIMSPVYLQDLLGISLDHAYRLSEDDLIDRLRADELIRRRLEAKPELETQLRDALLSVQEFMKLAASDEYGAVQTTRPRHIEDQFRHCLQAFQRTLQKVMTGSSFPVLNFSGEALLHFDPEMRSGARP